VVKPGNVNRSKEASQRRANERKEQYKQVRAHVKKEDGRVQAYGWSLPAVTSPTPAVKSATSETAAAPTSTSTSSGGNPDDESRAMAVNSGNMPVPVPVYCRPLMEKEPGMKIWCAAGVNLSGGRLPGDAAAASSDEKAKSADPSPEGTDDASSTVEDDPVEKLDKELSEGRRLVREAELEEEKERSSHVWICTSTQAISKVTVIDANSPADVLETFQVCSSHLLCIASVPGAKETDFRVDEELNRLIVEESEIAEEEAELERRKEQRHKDTNPDSTPVGGGDTQTSGNEIGVGSISFISCGNKEASQAMDQADAESEKVSKPSLRRVTAFELGSNVTNPTKPVLNRTHNVYEMGVDGEEDPCGELDPNATLPFISHHTLNLSRDLVPDNSKAPGGNAEDTAVDAVHPRFAGSSKGGPSSNSGDGSSGTSSKTPEVVEPMSSVLPTMWLGSQSGSIYVHSSVSNWKHCIHSIRLKDSVLCISHVRGRVMASLANGSIAIFHRNPTDGQWDLNNYHLLDLGKPHHSIRCMIQVQNKVWCGYRNKVFVVNPEMMKVESTFDAHPRRESQVRQMAWIGDGVWVSIRLDSTLRLYHAHTHQHLQDVDIEPYVSKMLGTGKLGFSFVRITALLVSSHRLWMGTGNGVIISVPLNSSTVVKSVPKSSEEQTGKEGKVDEAGVRVYADAHTDKMTVETFVPYCSMSQAQLSFHGHRDAVKFFVSVPGHGGLSNTARIPGSASSTNLKSQSAISHSSPSSSSRPSGGSELKAVGSLLVMSGGEGYIDFRIGDSEEGGDAAVEAGTGGKSVSRSEKSHLVVWQVPILKPVRT